MSVPRDFHREALRAEGLDDAAIDRVEKSLREHHLVVMVPPYLAQRLDSDKRRTTAATERERQLAAAVKYEGAIKDCQASTFHGREGFYRCRVRARYVVRRSEPVSAGDGRLATCKRHAGDPESHRHVNLSWQHSIYGPGAIEVVEDIYQPAVVA